MKADIRVHAVPESSRLEGVDVLRGLCVLLVVLHHIHLRFVLNHYPVRDRLPAPVEQVLFWSGYYAVITFFVTSGFLITRLSLRRWGTLGNVRVGTFYRMRLARIPPCLLLVLAILSALHAVVRRIKSGGATESRKQRVSQRRAIRPNGEIGRAGRMKEALHAKKRLVQLGYVERLVPTQVPE